MLKKGAIAPRPKDGIWLNTQGKDRPKRSKSKKKELKLGITYEGWKKRNGSKDAYVVENKIACVSFSTYKKFKELSDAAIAEIYNTDEIETRILNGDGASWIKQGIEDEGVYFQDVKSSVKSTQSYRKYKRMKAIQR
ncbi:UPF0236 family protein [Clostridium sp. JN-1]|uniref:UPF0236 family transposase-like protein n=1 Tax=Clostridium sp. JN-1 TaxID=2483110 RepID=UPI000F0B8FF8